MKITINNTEHEFNFRFCELVELCEKTGKQMDELESIAKEIKYTSLIGSIGMGKSEEEVKEILQNSTFDAVQSIINAFSLEVVAYLNPNSQSQAN